MRVLTWLPRALMPALALGLAAFALSRVRPALPDTTNALLTLGACLVAVLGVLGAVWLRRPSPMESARRFDRLFGLQERLSTALELAGGVIRADPDLARRQLDDAQRVAGAQRPDLLLPVRVEVREWGVVLALAALIALVALFPPVAAPADPQATDQAAIDGAVEAVEQILRDTAADPDLTDAQRDPLLEALQAQLETLQNPEVSLEEAIASLSEVEAQMAEAADSVGQQLAAQAAAQQAAADALNQAQTTPPSTTEGANGAQALSDALQQMQSGLSDATEAERQQAADALEQAADALQSTDPQAADALREAAEALRENQPQAAQDALQDAQNAQSQAQAQAQTQQNQVTRLQNNAEAAEQAQREAAERDSSAAPSEQGQGEQEQPGQGEGGEQGAQSQNGQTSDGEGGESGEETTDGSTPAEGAGNSPQLSGQQSTNAQSGQQGLGGDGAGDGAGNLNDDATERLQTRNPNLEQSDNDPDGAGERDYEAIFAPRFSVQSSGTTELELRADPGEAPLEETEADDNPLGEAVVPYVEVLGDYTNAANEALETGYIPLGLRDVVRGYFSSLDPAAP
ncbi:MAG: hypothetical protein MUC99_10930 [Anaerolineae bacterium]|nr:hypothetical protein [Anaerolineae bacterium]